MKLNTVVRLPDGREGTICHRFLDGEGGVWGHRRFAMPADGFGDELPRVEFMLREASVQHLFPHAECVGTEYEIVEAPSHG